MERIVAYCGLVCTDCKGYLATQAGDEPALEALAAEMREQFGLQDITAESVKCDGCLPASGCKCGYCATCDVRRCAVERAVATCAACADYGCDYLRTFWELAPSARATLDELRVARGAG